MELLSLVLGILGLVATLVGSVLAYVTFMSPMVRFKWYLKHADKWKKIHPRIEGLSDYYLYKDHPEFTIEEIDDRRWEREEPWMKKVSRPDKNCFAYQVALRVSGNIIHTENFIFMDGGRIYVPIPKVRYAGTENEEDNTYYYDETQLLLFKVIGKTHLDKDLEEFSKNAGILIGLK